MQHVILFGSRAAGTAHPCSDADLLVVIEPPEVLCTWRPADSAAEESRLGRALAPRLPFPVDIAVRTADQFAEARAVLGGVEYDAVRLGVVLYAGAPGRAPVIRRTPDQVQVDHVVGWLRRAHGSLARALDLTAGRTFGAPGQGPAHYAWSAAQRGVGAVLVWRGELPEKWDNADRLVARLAPLEPALAAALGRPLAAAHASVGAAAAVVRAVVFQLAREPALARPLAPLQAQWKYGRRLPAG